MTYVSSLGWFNRFVPAQSQAVLTPFYTNVLGLPFVRAGSAQVVDFLWAGEALIHELIYEGRMTSSDPRDADPRRAPLVPIYRTDDLDQLKVRLESLGAMVLPEERGAFGRQIFVLDPTAFIVGFREAPNDSRFTPDVIAAARRARGEAFNPGCKSMPPHVQELGWLIRRVENVEAQAAFYQTVIGLKLLARSEGAALLDLGDNTVLVLEPGGRVTAPPANRAELSSTLILRIKGFHDVRQSLIDHGVRIVHDLIAWDRGLLCYIADPEGGLIGLEEKHHPSVYAPEQTPFPEDLEARRRAVELSFALCAT